MYNKLSAINNNKRIYNSDDEPPEKKLVSDADVFIKQLAEKQRNTKTSLEEQLSSKQEFCKANEFVSITNYTSGSSTLGDFQTIMKHSDEIERLQTLGLSNEDILFLFDHNNGEKYFRNKHKNINETVLEKRLELIFQIINKSVDDSTEEKCITKDRLKNELILSTKPASVETKLLKFALENQQKYTEKLPHPMDDIKQVEKKLSYDLSSVDTKKIRRKARSLQKQIEAISRPAQLKEPEKVYKDSSSLVQNSQWDVKEPQTDQVTAGAKIYGCKPQNYYTIRDGQIVKLNTEDSSKKYSRQKLSVEEIKKIPKFENYTAGTPSNTLYLKNLANNANEDDLKEIFSKFSKEKTLSIKVMKGKMRGQAFVQVEDEDVAMRLLDECNGVIFSNRPIIIQFGRASNPNKKT